MPPMQSTAAPLFAVLAMSFVFRHLLLLLSVISEILVVYICAQNSSLPAWQHCGDTDK